MENLIFLLPMLVGVGLAALAGAFDSDDDAPEPEPEPEGPPQVADGQGTILTGSAEDDSLTLTDPDGGIVDGRGGADTILIDPGAPPEGLHVDRGGDGFGPHPAVIPDPVAGTWTAPDDRELPVGLTEVTLDGGDSLAVQSGFVFVEATGGGNSIDLSGAGYASLVGGDGDTIHGAGAGGTVEADLRGDAHYLGSDGVDIVRAGNATSPVDGGGGNDRLISNLRDTANHLRGGDGNDYLVGSLNALEGSGGESDQHYWRIDNAADTLDGGAGDDTIVGAADDVVITGTGADHVEGWVQGGRPMIVTDFDPTQDTARLIVDGGDIGRSENEDMTRFAARIELVESDGNTTLMVDGRPATVLQGVTGASAMLSDDYGTYDMTGQPATGSATLTIYRFPSIST